MTEWRVTAPRIAETVYVIEHVGSGPVVGFVRLARSTLCLRRGEEAFDRSIAPHVA